MLLPGLCPCLALRVKIRKLPHAVHDHLRVFVVADRNAAGNDDGRRFIEK